MGRKSKAQLAAEAAPAASIEIQETTQVADTPAPADAPVQEQPETESNPAESNEAPSEGPAASGDAEKAPEEDALGPDEEPLAPQVYAAATAEGELPELVSTVLSQNEDQEHVYVGPNNGIYFESPMVQYVDGLKKIKNPFYKGN